MGQSGWWHRIRQCQLPHHGVAAAAQDLTWRKDIAPLIKEQCGACHGASAPSYEDWNLDRKNFEAKKIGPRMDNYTDFMRHVVWPATGSLVILAVKARSIPSPARPRT